MNSDEEGADSRREFLKAAGRFAAITPPTMTLLLSTSMNSSAVASSGGVSTAHANNGYGQEKRGIFDGENPGSNKGGGVAQGGSGAGQAGKDSKQDTTKLR